MFQIVLPILLVGWGVGSLNFIDRMSDEFEFYTIGFPEKNSLKNYTGVSNVIPETFHGSVTILTSQIAYYNTSIMLPKPDLIHVYDWSVYLAGVYASKYWNVPLVVSMRLSVNLLSQIGIHNVFNIQTKDGFWINNAIREMEIIGLRYAQVITQVSHSYQESFFKIEGLKEKTIVVPNGIDLLIWNKYKKIDYMNSADAVILPSLHEPFGIVGLEALASKNILLSSRVNGLSDFLNDNNSIFCGVTAAEIENSFNKLLSLSKKQKNTLIQNGLKTCEEYSWDNAVLKMKEAYKKAIE